MTKNSRRKKIIRKQARITGESYTRTRRLIAKDAGHITPGPGPYEPSNATNLLHELQRTVEARGWTLERWQGDRLDDNGLAGHPESQWDYPEAYGGIIFDGDDEDAPYLPSCGFSFGDEFSEPELIVVETAGNWGGCDQHRTIEHSLPATAEGIARLPVLLPQIEGQARVMNARELIECTAHGLCGQNVQARNELRQARIGWIGAMVEAHKTVMTDQQRAELKAWEDVNLDGYSVGTHDWPGWEAFIGPYPNPDQRPARHP